MAKILSPFLYALFMYPVLDYRNGRGRWLYGLAIGESVSIDGVKMLLQT